MRSSFIKRNRATNWKTFNSEVYELVVLESMPFAGHRDSWGISSTAALARDLQPFILRDADKEVRRDASSGTRDTGGADLLASVAVVA